MQINVKGIVDEFIEKRFKEDRFDTLVNILNHLNISYRVESIDDVRNVVITGKAGCGKTTIAEALAIIFNSKETINDMPEELKNKKIFY